MQTPISSVGSVPYLSTQVPPVNDDTYPADPIQKFDLNGEWWSVLDNVCNFVKDNWVDVALMATMFVLAAHLLQGRRGRSALSEWCGIQGGRGGVPCNSCLELAGRSDVDRLSGNSVRAGGEWCEEYFPRRSRVAEVVLLE